MLMKVALGQEKADLAVVNARLVNVYTGEFLNDWTFSPSCNFLKLNCVSRFSNTCKFWKQAEYKTTPIFWKKDIEGKF